ncbi:MAG: C25 family cysteine peptidase [Ginsengibacter sp.]
MKKFLLPILVFLTATGFSQSASNSWINYNNTYYKFYIASDGMYRISQGALNSAGLGNIPAEQFQLWHNGAEQSIYTSVASGILSSSDYIEFWGMRNDGKMDNKLYRDPDFQLSDHYSLQTDTSAYYLTVNTSSANLRNVNVVNDVANNVLTAEPWFMNTRGVYFNTRINPGFAIPAGGVYVFSSSYDKGEGWSSQDIAPGPGYTFQMDSLFANTSGPSASVKFAVAGTALNGRNVQVKFNNTTIDDEAMPYFNYLKKQIDNVPLSLFINPAWARFTFTDASSVTTDRYVISFLELTYPSFWNFNNQQYFYFKLPASNTGNYLVINNFNNSGIAPVLLDISNNKRYIGDIISTPGQIKFALPASAIANREFRLVSQAPGAISAITTFQKRNFINFSTATNQGNYLIISNKSLYTSTTGDNNVDLYRQYRSSSAGGGFNAKVVDIDELVDQFAYGIKKHPAAIKDFVKFAKSNFSVTPSYLFLIGKGVTYDEYITNSQSVFADKLNLVPTFGSPASDVLLSSPYGSIVPTFPVGRLSVVSGDEVGRYLGKIKEYELAQTASQTIANKLWMKNIVQIVGGKDSDENNLFRQYMYGYKNILEDTLYGGHVELFSKTSNSAVQLISGQRVEQLFSEGISILSYFGHSSANTLEFNLSDPSAYNNPGKYPFFLVSGCTAGNNYIYDTLRILQNSLSISENFVLASERGSIAFLASTHYGIPPFLDDYNTHLYDNLRGKNYGAPIGDDIRNVIKELNGDVSDVYYYTRTDLEEMALHGDPAIKINPHPKPDYVIEEPLVKINPAFISISQEKFTLDAKTYNIGKAISDSIYFDVKRIYPNGTSEILLHKRIKAPYYSDSIHLVIPIIPTRDKGLNKIVVTIDADNEVSEESESNNSFTKEVYIYQDEARPSYPGDFSIINVANQKLYASTANALSTAKDYELEVDTTLLFNSPIKVNRSLNSTGGILEFDPGITYNNNTVYYWRVALKPTSGLPADYHWNNASFLYLANSAAGFNQSHYYQHLYSDTQNIKLDSSRKWKFSTVTNILEAKNGVFPTAAANATDFSAFVNGSEFVQSVCGISGIIFNVLDPITLKPWYNTVGATGSFGSDQVCDYNRLANFQYNILDPAKRAAAMHFLRDSIPNNFIVIVRNISGTNPASNTYAADWLADTATLGAGNSLYQVLRAQGFSTIDSFNRPRSFVFMYQKNNAEFLPRAVFSEGISEKIILSHTIVTPDTLGIITSPVFGPVKQWKEMHWRGTSEENPSQDDPTVDIIGVDNSGNKSTLLTVNKMQQDVDISSIDAIQYPYIQLKMHNLDSITLTPYQLSYWRLNSIPAPEGALAPNIFISGKDTLQQGEIYNFGIAFKNISIPSFDSILIKLTIIDNNNVTHVISLPKQKPLISGDTILFKYNLDTKAYPGNNTIFIDFNPSNNQPELYHYNNFLYKNFFVKPDNINPLLDVTFDGVHILNQDIVSARPHILIKLKDESKFLSLSDTSLLKVQLRYPDGSLRTIAFDNDTLRFTPANLSQGNNTATIEFSPILTGNNENDNSYELIVSGKDVIGNTAGQLDYHVSFRVFSKPMISNLMNYPNPFTSQTAFVFTITGYQIPQNIRIQILTITGKVIREITTNELGPLHIGRNITDFKWDGSDMYGQKVANGVYLYRVLTNLNGKAMDKFRDTGDNTDTYFTKGYGKMYFMR